MFDTCYWATYLINDRFFSQRLTSSILNKCYCPRRGRLLKKYQRFVRVNIITPEITIRAQPKIIKLFMDSLKNTTDNTKANKSREYRNGAITEISPERVASTTAKYASEAVQTELVNSKASLEEGLSNESKSGTVINPATREAKKAQNEMVITGMESDIDLVIMSLTARKKTAATANKVAGLNPSRPG